MTFSLSRAAKLTLVIYEKIHLIQTDKYKLARSVIYFLNSSVWLDNSTGSFATTHELGMEKYKSTSAPNDNDRNVLDKKK